MLWWWQPWRLVQRLCGCCRAALGQPSHSKESRHTGDHRFAEGTAGRRLTCGGGGRLETSCGGERAHISGHVLSRRRHDDANIALNN